MWLVAVLPLPAEVSDGSSSGTPLTLHITSTASLTATVLPVSATSSISTVPQASVSGTAPRPYTATGGPLDYTSPTAGVNLGASAFDLVVEAGVNTVSIGATALTASASSTVSGASGPQTTSAGAGLTGLEISFGAIDATIDPLSGSTTFLDSQALRVTTGVISSTATVTGAGPFGASFSTSVADFELSMFGVSLLSYAPVSLAADLEAGNPVNTIIDLEEVTISLPDGLAGLEASGLIFISNTGTANDGLLSGSASASALTLGFQNIHIRAVVGGLITMDTRINGTIETAGTEAWQLVPEPTPALLVVGGISALALRRHRP